MRRNPKIEAGLMLLATFMLIVVQLGSVARAQTAPNYYFDPT